MEWLETADYIPSGLDLAILGTNDDSSLGEINEFNSQNQIVVTYTGENTIQFSYNGDGIRVGKNVNGSIEKYLYDTGNHVVLEVDGDGEQTAENIYGIYNVSRIIGNNSYSYLHNGHGDVTALLDSDENAVNRYTYDAFGVILTSTETVENPFTYAGYWYDSETGLYYLMARYYNPVNGRFLSEDPARDGYNWYVYCNNNPSVYCDSNGQYVQIIEWVYYSPFIQQGLQYISSGISYAWTSVSSFIVQNWHVVQQAAYEVSLYGPAIADSVNSWFQSGYSNQVQQAASEANNKTNNASNNSGKNSNGNNTSKNSNSHNPKDPKNWNKNSVRVNSKELYNNKNIRIDVENPNPGQRPGQVHLQINSGANKGKYIFDNVSKKFYDVSTGEIASKNIQEYLQNPDIINAIDKGLTKYLGVSGIK